MNDYSENYFTNPDGLKQFYRDYNHVGDGVPVVLCLPGLTRNSRDYAEIASHMAKTCRVIVVDQRGRGYSDWDPDPSRYRPDVYVSDMMALLAHLRVSKVIAFGTSLGGLMTFMMAAMHPGVLLGAVINDIGPEVDPKGVNRIKSFVGKIAPPTTWDEAVAVSKAASKTAFPKFTDNDWLWLAKKLYVEEDGKITAQYDPAISKNFDATDTETPPDLWPIFDLSAGVPMVVLRGALSDIMSAETLEKMATRHPDLVPVTVPDKGHTPLMTEPESLKAIDAFLERCR